MRALHQPACGSAYPTGALPLFADVAIAALNPEGVLRHFRERSGIHYFALSAGKPKHVAKAERILRHEFELNNETHVLPETFDWLANPSRDLEWLILLHKFYYSRDLALAYDASGEEMFARKWVELVASWIAQVPAGFVNSQVVGRRLQQWLLAYHHLVPGRQCAAITPDFLLALLRSMQSQALFLRDNLTPEGNHRTIELSALFQFAVLFPELRESAGLQAFAVEALVDNLRDDFLADGVQKELSTDYHHTALKNFLRVRELAGLNGVALPQEFDRIMRRALEFSIFAHRPDGELPAINDGDVNSYLSLLRKAHRQYPVQGLLYVASRGLEGEPPSQRSRHFESSGYCILRSEWNEAPYADARYCFFDCGPLGYGSHGHYDLLSFEAAAFGHSLVIDPGRYTYHEDQPVNWRHRFKGTAAHNTVMVDGKDQCRYRCGAPEGAEPAASVLSFASAPGFDFVRGRALSPEYPVIHERCVVFAVGEYWIISDRLLADGEHRYDQFFHLPVEAQGKLQRLPEAQGLGVRTPQCLILQPRTAGVDLSVEEGFVSPEYGLKHPAPVLRYAQGASGNAAYQTFLYPFHDAAPTVQLGVLPVRVGQEGLAAEACRALDIHIDAAEGRWQDLLLINHVDTETELNCENLACRTDVLFLRRDETGTLVALMAEGLRSLSIGDELQIPDSGARWRLSCSDGRVFWRREGREGEAQLAQLTDLPLLLDSVLSAWEAA
ncbi:alginate lyase family protein [Methyloterricola oryzae]|uniref:alginate lyase family protein n=1 Tax=Methyloterricola oryzae TaxID=1495050 RepID=UPI0005EB7BCF|nr:alginate lyase family protein [Methyloterricola oryzae]